jgi:hypothetical protein
VIRIAEAVVRFSFPNLNLAGRCAAMQPVVLVWRVSPLAKNMAQTRSKATVREQTYPVRMSKWKIVNI